MVMRLVRDEPDVQLDEVRGEGVENDATVLTDLSPLAATGTLGPKPGPGPKARKARMRMSSKSPSQVIAVPEFGASEPRDQEQDASAEAGSERPGSDDANPPAEGRAGDQRADQAEVPADPNGQADRTAEAESLTETDPAAATDSPADAGGSAEGDAPAEGHPTEGDPSAVDAVAEAPTGGSPPVAPEAPSAEEMSDGAVPRPAKRRSADTDEDGDDAGDADDEPVPAATLEALLLTTHHPLTPLRLKELLSAGSARAVRKAIEALNDQYEQTGRCFRIEQVAGGYQILTLPEFGDALKRLHQKEADAKLTKAALETLSIIAYKQPILRADVEAIRGVACGETIRSLMEKHLVKIAGRAEEPGRPILYGTTKRFLELFGLNSLKDLPKPEEFKPPTA